MSPRLFLILSFFIALNACSSGSDSDNSKAPMAGYQLPDSIEVLEAQE